MAKVEAAPSVTATERRPSAAAPSRGRAPAGDAGRALPDAGAVPAHGGVGAPVRQLRARRRRPRQHLALLHRARRRLLLRLRRIGAVRVLTGGVRRRRRIHLRVGDTRRGVRHRHVLGRPPCRDRRDVCDRVRVRVPHAPRFGVLPRDRDARACRRSSSKSSGAGPASRARPATPRPASGRSPSSGSRSARRVGTGSSGCGWSRSRW